MKHASYKKTSRIAVLSLICAGLGIISVVFFPLMEVLDVGGHAVLTFLLFSKIAFVLGVISLLILFIRRKALKGWSYAILSIILSIPAIWSEYEVRGSVRIRMERMKANSLEYNLRVLGKSLIQYAQENDSRLPPAEKWCDSLLESNKNIKYENFKHPKLDNAEVNFAFNKHLNEMSLADVPGDVVLLFEAEGNWNLNGNGELIKQRDKDHKLIYVFYVDGSVKSYWFYKKAVRDFNEKGMFYKPLRWWSSQ